MKELTTSQQHLIDILVNILPITSWAVADAIISKRINQLLTESKVDQQKVFTDFELCREILNRVPDLSGTINVAANLEFVYTLIRLGVEAERISFSSPDPRKRDTALKLFGVGAVYNYNNILGDDEDMPIFDVVVGNPPFKGDGKNAIYQKFFKTAMQDCVAEDGYVALITPTPMIKGLAGERVDKVIMPGMSNVLLINVTDLRARYFKSESSTFCYFIVQNKEYENTTTIVTEGDTITTQFTGTVPRSNNLEVAFRLWNKCFSGRNEFGCTTSDCGKKSSVNPNGDTEVVRTINADGTKQTHRVDIVKDHWLLNTPKVLITIMGRKGFIDYTHNRIPSLDHLMASIPTRSDLESESLMSLLNTSFERSHAELYGETKDFWYSFIRHLAAVPLDRQWTDDGLIEYFNLDDEERQEMLEAAK